MDSSKQTPSIAARVLTSRRGSWSAALWRLFCVAAALSLAGCVTQDHGHFEREAVAADHAVASRAGAEILRRGGNAVDAAVATSFTLSVVRPYSCGIGGGGFMVIRFGDGELGRRPPTGAVAGGSVALNYREVCPAAVGPEFFESRDDLSSQYGALSVGVPGTVAGLLHALDRYGTLDRATVLAPAISAAERGFVVDSHYAAEARDAIADFEKHPEWKARFAWVWERYLRRGKVTVGDRIRNPEQAAALRLIAAQGPDAFYRGPIADAIVRTLESDGGVLTRDDLARFPVATVEPLTFQAFGRTFLTMPPPSSGGVAMGEAMGIYERLWDRSTTRMATGAWLLLRPWLSNPSILAPERAVTSLGTASVSAESTRVRADSPVNFHFLAESFKHAFADRSRWLGDPAFCDVPVARLLSSDYLDARADASDFSRTRPADAYGTMDSTEPAPSREDRGTSHFNVVDRWGTAVACTETINLGFGSLLAVPEYGFILNDQLDDFTTRSGQANAFGLKQSDRNLPAPGKRPLSSMTPTIVLGATGKIEAVAGASGGPRIITGTTQALLNALIWNQDAAHAVTAPRIHHQWSPDVLRLEPSLAKPGCGRRSLAEDLESRGHKVAPIESVSEVQLIKRGWIDRVHGWFYFAVEQHDGWDAACDPRKGGKPAGR